MSSRGLRNESVLIEQNIKNRNYEKIELLRANNVRKFITNQAHTLWRTHSLPTLSLSHTHRQYVYMLERKRDRVVGLKIAWGLKLIVTNAVLFSHCLSVYIYKNSVSGI